MFNVFSRRVPLLVMLFLVAMVGAAPVRGDISADSWALTTRAELDLGEGPISDTVMASADNEDGPLPVLPFALTHTATVDLGVGQSSVGTSSYDFSTAGDTGLFQFSFDHLVVGALDTSSASSSGSLVFKPDTDISFALSGDYALTGTGLVHLDLSLADLGGNMLFSTFQETSDVMDQAFAFSANDGMLNAGTFYRLLYDFHIEGVDPSSLSATGGIDLQLGVQVVPAPGAVALGLVGLGMLALVRRRFG